MKHTSSITCVFMVKPINDIYTDTFSWALASIRFNLRHFLHVQKISLTKNYQCNLHSNSYIYSKLCFPKGHLCPRGPFGYNSYTIYKLDAETKVTKRFRNPRARGCSVPSEARALLRARGFLNRLVAVG